jgi:acetyl esterase
VSLCPEDRIDPEILAAWRAVREHVGPLATRSDLTIAEARRLNDLQNEFWNVDLPAIDLIEEFEIPPAVELATPGIAAVRYRPSGAVGRILFVHGGGFSACDKRSHERFVRLLSLAARAEVVGIDYRRAPEHRFPKPLDDTVAALRSLIGLGGAFVLCGDSAGATLAVSAALHEVSAGRTSGQGLVLAYGVFGRELDLPSHAQFRDGFWLTTDGVGACWEQYLSSGDADNLAIPLLAPGNLLAALPPISLVSAELDPLVSDTLALKARLDVLERNDQVHIQSGALHGFLQMTSCCMAARQVTSMIGRHCRVLLDQPRRDG